jgi:hypothetical protein
MEPPTCSWSTMHYTREFPRADPNICSRTTLQHLSTTLVYSFNLKCIVYKSNKKKKRTSEISSLVHTCIFGCIYKLDPTHARHSKICSRHVIISTLMECWILKKRKQKQYLQELFPLEVEKRSNISSMEMLLWRLSTVMSYD